MLNVYLGDCENEVYNPPVYFIRKRRKTPVFRHGDIRRVHLICVSN